MTPLGPDDSVARMERPPVPPQVRPQVYVINLARSPDRLAFIAERLDRAGLKWRRVEAVDGRALGDPPWPDFDEFSFRYLWGMPPHANELGCYLSHHRAMQAFLATDEPFAVILEDDAAVTEELREVMDDLVAHAGEWDIVKLESRHWGMPVTMRQLGKGRRLVAYTQRSTGSTAYIVNRKAAAAYTRKLLPMRLPYDHAFDQVWRYGIRMRGVLPRPVHGGGFPSDIGYRTREAARRGFSRRVVAPFYRGQIEIARVLHYLIRDPVWLMWLVNTAKAKVHERSA